MKRTKSEQRVLSTTSSPHQWPSGCCCRSRFSWAREIASAISVFSHAEPAAPSGKTLGNAIRFADDGAIGLGCLCGHFRALARQMAVAGGDAIVGRDLVTLAGRFRFRPEVEPDIFPGVAALRVEAQAGRWFVAAMDHAIFAAAVFRDAIDHAVFFPLHFLQQLRVTR